MVGKNPSRAIWQAASELNARIGNVAANKQPTDFGNLVDAETLVPSSLRKSYSQFYATIVFLNRRGRHEGKVEQTRIPNSIPKLFFCIVFQNRNFAEKWGVLVAKIAITCQINEMDFNSVTNARKTFQRIVACFKSPYFRCLV